MKNRIELPAKMNYPREGNIEDYYGRLGITVIGPEEGDNLLLVVELPDDYSVEGTDHRLWHNLVNKKGEILAEIFYKSDPWDRDIFINFN
jgi:hypothetical protein